MFGANDRGIPVKNVRDFEEALEILGKNYEIEIYPNARHAFANPTSPNFNPAVAEQSMDPYYRVSGSALVGDGRLVTANHSSEDSFSGARSQTSKTSSGRDT